jgi:hypothetical protein
MAIFTGAGLHARVYVTLQSMHVKIAYLSGVQSSV